MRLSKVEKKQLGIFVAIAYGVTVLMGLVMGYGYAADKNIGIFPNAQMMYPAAGVMLAYFLTRRGDCGIPKRFFFSYLAATSLMIVCALLSVTTGKLTWISISQLVLIGGSILCGVLLLMEKKEKRELYGLRLKNGKASAFCVVLFIALYFLRTVIAYGVSGQMWVMGLIVSDPQTWLYAICLPINFFLSLIAFFGEEYGWRYYLQPLLQKRYGKRLGVLFLGVVWGLWHLPVNFFYYTSPAYGLISMAGQQITCITLGIFFAYAYMKTQNIWVPVILHYLNNNLVPLISGSYSGDILQNQSVSWAALLPALVLNGVIFGGFLLARVYRKRTI